MFFLQFYSIYKNLCNFQIIVCILSTVDLIFLNGKSHYYPLKDIVGPSFCYFHVYTGLWFGMYGQFSSLFITFYRYICIFYGKKLLQLKISPKVRSKTKLLFYGLFINRSTIYKHPRNSLFILESTYLYLNMQFLIEI